MALLVPFRGLLPREEFAEEVSCDTQLSDEESLAIITTNPRNFLGVIQSHLEFPDAAVFPDAVYERARERFEAILSEGLLVHDESPSLYLYGIADRDRVRAGVVGRIAVGDYESGDVKRHENTLPSQVEHRKRLFVRTGAEPTPILLTYRENSALSELVEEEIAAPPCWQVRTSTGTRHMMWRVERVAEIVDAFRAIPALYIADGHHRAESIALGCKELRARNPHHTGQEGYNYLLCALFPHGQVSTLPYHRALKSLCGKSVEGVLRELELRYAVHPNGAAAPERKGEIGFYVAGRWYALIPKASDPRDGPVERLEVSRLHKNVLDPIFSECEEIEGGNVSFVSGHLGVEHLKELVDSGEAACAFALFKTSVEEMMEIADHGSIMAPKATWFEPRLRSGMVISTIDP